MTTAAGADTSTGDDWRIERGVTPSAHFSRVEESMIHQGAVIGLLATKIEDRDGNRYDRDLVRHPGAVAIVAVDGQDVVLVKQYRAALNGEIIEIPAGKRDVADEPPVETAHRELQEEVGLKAGSMELLINIHHSPGFCDEYGHIFLATDVESVPQRREGPEELAMTIERRPLAEAVEMCLDGRITDAKSVSGILAAARRLGIG